ncbi:hypothetical protein M501DRAFT_914950, partial [Patellaria atrata CBS 101060]
MATETSSLPVNGNYGTHQSPGYGVEQHNFSAHATHNSNAAVYNQSTPPTSNQASSNNGDSSTPTLTKAEIAWYFVEQYYTNMSTKPEKLFLFYNKRSQFVYGLEEEKVPVCVGQKSIRERIGELEFQECKVRVTNVDSQASDQNIVIQVIGQMSNKSAPHRKFVQTFVLAEQTNGYFVLNDIFRFLTEEEDELEPEEVPQHSALAGGYEEPAPTITDTAHETLTSSADLAEQENDASVVDKELEELIEQEDAAAKDTAAVSAEINGTPVPEAVDAPEAEEAPEEDIPTKEPEPSVENTQPPAEQETSQPEKPKEPESTPAAPVATPAPAPKPAAPKTWANLVAANRVATPVTPKPGSTNSQPSAQTKAPPPVQTEAQSHPTSIPAGPARDASPGTPDSAAGWQSVGPDHNKRQSRVQLQPSPQENQGTRAYIKNVHEGVDGDTLKAALSKHGELAYFDISRQKNCAFVDFATPAGFQAAVAANPHQIGTEQIFVEERRLRTGPYSYQRGGMPRGRGDGRPGNQGRGGFNKDGNRGGFTPRGGRGNTTPR